MKSETYISSDDSRFLREALKDYSGEKCLEIGAGNGGSLLELRKNFDMIVGTDICRPGMDDWKSNGLNFILADRASCIRPSTFDLVAFNPPYLTGKVTDNAVDGGENLEVPRGFLEDAIMAVKITGKILFLLNDEADIEVFGALCQKSGFVLHKLATRRVFYEELCLYVAQMA